MNLTQIPNWIKKLVKIFNFVHKSTKRKWNISKFYKNAVAVELSVLLMSYGRPFQWIVAQSLENSFFFAVPNWTWGKQIFQCNPFKINIHLFHAIFIFDVFLLNIYILATMLIKSCENVQKWVEINFRIVLDMNFVKNSETEAFPILIKNYQFSSAARFRFSADENSYENHRFARYWLSYYILLNNSVFTRKGSLKWKSWFCYLFIVDPFWKCR